MAVFLNFKVSDDERAKLERAAKIGTLKERYSWSTGDHEKVLTPQSLSEFIRESEARLESAGKTTARPRRGKTRASS